MFISDRKLADNNYSTSNRLKSPYKNRVIINNNPRFCFSKNYNAVKNQNMYVSFLGNKVVILDGGLHANNLKYFVQALIKNIDLRFIDVEVNPKFYLAKQMKSLKERLIQVNSLPQQEKPDYLVIPMLFDGGDLISLSRYTGIKITHKNVHDHKAAIMQLLKNIAQNPEKYNRKRLDPSNQGMEHLYTIIQEINKAVASGIKVYVPAGHPYNLPIDWLALKRGVKPEVSHYIRTGEDINHTVAGIKQEVEKKNLYNLNLLSLSDANIIGLNNMRGTKHLYAGNDGFITQRERGVYNFYPIRNKNDEVLGFCFFDEKTIDYPIGNYFGIEHFANILKFVGLPVEKVLATDSEHKAFKKYLRWKLLLPKRDFSGKIFKVEQIFSPSQIRKKKIKLRGDYVDSSLKLFFRKNEKGYVIFPNCDCEGSGRPSIIGMWGSCFSIFNAIKKDIEKTNSLTVNLVA